MARALSPGQFAVLEAHEILYRIGEVEKGLQTSEKVREFAKYLLLTEFQRAPALSTAESIGSHNYASQAVLAQLPKGTNSRISYVADTAGDCVIRFQTNEAYPNPRSKNQKDAEFFDLSTGCLGSSSIYTASATFSCSLESSRCISRTVWGTFVFDQFSADASQFSVIQLELGSAAKPVIFRLQQ
jgi:hypothetical protein